MTPVNRRTTAVRHRYGHRVLVTAAVTIAVVSAAVVAGCATDRYLPAGFAGNLIRDLSRGSPGHPRYSEAAALQEADVTAGQAGATARRTVPGTIESIELELEHDIPTWEVDVLTARGTWHELEIDGVGGAVLANHIEIDGDDTDEIAALRAARVGVIEAIAVAARSARGTVFSAELDDHAGRHPTWKVQTLESSGVRHQRTVDSVTGALVSEPPETGGEN